MLKTIGLPNKPAFNRNNNNRSDFSRNNNSKPASKKNNGNNKVNEFSISRNNMEYAKKLRKLFKSRKLKSEKMSKSQNLAKSKKKLSKKGNSINFSTIEAGPKFLNFNVKIAFNCLWLAFTKTSIL